MATDKTDFESGKYSIQLEHGTGKLKLLRHGEDWVDDPMYSKMLIHIMYEVSRLRKILSDVSYDFDPDTGALGNTCGPEMLKLIREYEDHFGINLNEVEDIN